LKWHFKLFSLQIGSYHAKNYQTYLDLVHDLLQVEKHDKLTLRNYHQHSIGFAPLLEVHHNVKDNKRGDGSNNYQKKFGKFKKGKRNSKNMKNGAKGQGKDKGKTFTCHKCGGPNHFAKKCRTPKHLIELYQRFLKESNKNKRSYEAHFNDEIKEATTSGTIPSNPEMSKLTDNDDMYMENTVVEYKSNDVFEDLKYAHFVTPCIIETLNHCLNLQLSPNARTNRVIEVQNQNSSENIENSNSCDRGPDDSVQEI
jgi:hypothetical protein